MSPPSRNAGHPKHHDRADAVLFPVAALYGAIAVPLSLAVQDRGSGLIPGLATPAGHAHELLFGYALAVMAGFLLQRTTAIRLALALVLWLSARTTYLLDGATPAAQALILAFPLVLGLLVTPRLFVSAKKVRNQALAPIIAGFCLAAAAYPATSGGGPLLSRAVVLEVSILLLTLLMLFMGGRIIAPAAAGAIQRSGGYLAARVQPRIEGSLLAVMGVAIGLVLATEARAAAGMLLIGAAALAAVRLARWRLWRCRSRPDLVSLGIGYAWLAIGLALLGDAWSFGWLPWSAAVHGITVGALGTLTATVMLRTRLIACKQDPGIRLPLWVALAMSLAAGLRIVGDPWAVWVAAGLWSLALLLVAFKLVAIPRADSPPAPEGTSGRQD